MIVGIDARFIGPQGTGLGKYTQKLIENLQNFDNRNHYSIFLKRDNWNFLKLKNRNFSKVLADVNWYSVDEQVKMPAIFARQKLNLLHIPHFNVPVFYKGKFVVTIHDLIHHEFSQESATTKNYPAFMLKRLGYKFVINSAVRKSSKIIVPSNFVKEDILKNFQVDSAKIVVTYEAAEEEYFNESKNPQVLKKYNIKQPFVIYVGNAYPHKNLTKLLEAIKSLNQNNSPKINLVIVSARDVFTKRLEKEVESLGIRKFVNLTGYVEAGDLAKIFKNASAYIFPSLSEGFGIPGLNAMASGIPVVASNVPTLKEVYGNAALYFDPNNANQIKDKLRQIVTSKKTRDDLIEKGNVQVQKYSWRKMAQQTLKVYESTK